MASMASKFSKCFTFNLILLLNAILFFAIVLIQRHAKIYTTIASSGNVREPEWFDVVAKELGDKYMKVGLVNMDGIMEKFHSSKSDIVRVQFDHVREDITWSDVFPTWIDENSSECPDIPMPIFEDYEQLDVVVAKMDCTECDEAHGLRDVFRLQVNLVAANLLVRSWGAKANTPVFAVFIGKCAPMWEIFSCDEVLWSDGNSWVFKPSLRRIKQKVLLPVGSCQLSPSSPDDELWRSQVSDISQTHNYSLPRQPREAYVTVLHSSEAYVCGAIALAQSIILSNSTKDLILLADRHISPRSLHGLRAAGWKIKLIERIRSHHSNNGTYNKWNYSKLRIWQLQEYDKVMFIDSDFIVTKNLDKLFTYPQLSASPNDGHRFNSGLMLVEPSKCMFKYLMSKRKAVESYNGGDQGFLNEMFTWWHRLPAKVNYLKYFDYPGDLEHQIPRDVHAVHYIGLKPWTCYRDYDCNWDRLEFQIYASDSVNEKWWHVYDAMPKKLRRFCSLTSEINVRILKHRERAEKDNLPDGHWKIKIKDPRRLD